MLFFLLIKPLSDLLSPIAGDFNFSPVLILCVICLSLVGLEPAQLSVSEERHLAILTELPFVVPFEERVKVLHRRPAVQKIHILCVILEQNCAFALCIMLLLVIC